MHPNQPVNSSTQQQAHFEAGKGFLPAKNQIPAFLGCWGIFKADLCYLARSDLCHVHHGIGREAPVSAAAGFLSVFHITEFASCIKNNIFTSNESYWQRQDFTRPSQREALMKGLIVPRDSCKSSFSSRCYSRTGIIKGWCCFVDWGTINYFLHSDLILNIHPLCIYFCSGFLLLLLLINMWNISGLYDTCCFWFSKVGTWNMEISLDWQFSSSSHLNEEIILLILKKYLVSFRAIVSGVNHYKEQNWNEIPA